MWISSRKTFCANTLHRRGLQLAVAQAACFLCSPEADRSQGHRARKIKVPSSVPSFSDNPEALCPRIAAIVPRSRTFAGSHCRRPYLHLPSLPPPPCTQGPLCCLLRQLSPLHPARPFRTARRSAGSSFKRLEPLARGLAGKFQGSGFRAAAAFLGGGAAYQHQAILAICCSSGL